MGDIGHGRRVFLVLHEYSSVFQCATMSSNLAKALTPKVAGWGIVVLRLLEGSLLEVEAIGGIATRDGYTIQGRRDILLPWSYLLIC